MASCQHPHSAAKSPNDFSREKPLPQPLNQPILPIPILGCCEAPPSRGERETYNTDTRVVDRATSNNWGTSARGTSACGLIAEGMNRPITSLPHQGCGVIFKVSGDDQAYSKDLHRGDPNDSIKDGD